MHDVAQLGATPEADGVLRLVDSSLLVAPDRTGSVPSGRGTEIPTWDSSWDTVDWTARGSESVAAPATPVPTMNNEASDSTLTGRSGPIRRVR